jgi:ligand-binding sensor domain-containing protein/DNA-binding CsgD family transcriptional regulator
MKLKFKFLNRYLFFLQFLSVPLFCQQKISGNIHEFVNLSRGLIKGLAVDSYGFVWLVTDVGLYRFDGRKATFYNEACTGGFLKSIKSLSDGSLIVTHDEGVTKIIPHIHTPKFQILASGELFPTNDKMFFPKTIFEDSKQRIWIGEDNGISLIKNGERTKFFSDKIRSPGNIFRNFSFGEDDSGNIWAISYNGAFFRYSDYLNKFIDAPLPTEIDKITQLFILSNNTFLLGGSSGLFKVKVLPDLSFGAITRLKTPTGIKSGVRVDRQIFFGTEKNGLFVVPIDEIGKAYSEIIDLPFDDIIDLSYDPNNGLWMVSNESFASFKTGFFEKIDLSNPDFPVDAIFENNQGDIYVSSGGCIDKIFFFGKSGIKTRKLVQNVRSVTALFGNEEDLYWGGLDGNIYKMRVRDKKITELKSLNKGFKINQIYKDFNDNLWILGNPRYGPLRMDPKGQMKLFSKKSERGLKVIAQEPDGNIFLGGSSPDAFLFFLDKKRDTLINISVSLPFPVSGDFFINQIFIDKKGELLLASNQGLLQYIYSSAFPSTGKLKRLRWDKFPENLNVVGLTKGLNNHLWISTSEGLIFITPEQQIIYDNNTGIPGRILAPRGIINDQRGFIWVGASKGLGLLRKDKSGNKISATPLIQGISINGVKRLNQNPKNIILHYRDNISFQLFSSIFPSHEVKYQVKYQNSNQWLPISSSHEHLISNMSSGRQVIWFRSQKEGGYEWSIPLKVEINVSKPWYFTTWGIMLLLSCLFLSFYILNRFLAQKRLLHLEKEKYQKLKEQAYQNEIIQKDKQFAAYTLHLIQKNEDLKNLQAAIYDLKRSLGERSQSKLKRILSLINFSFKNDEEWDRFRYYFEDIYRGFFEKLLSMYPDLTPQDLRLCALIRLNLSINEQASILGISIDSIKTARFRLKKKFSLDSIHQLMDVIMQI